MNNNNLNKLIDFHVHLFPDNFFDAIWKYFAKEYKWNVIYKYYTNKCINFLKIKNVIYIVYSNYAHKTGVAEYLNEWNTTILNQYKGLYCFAAFHPDDKNAIKNAEKILSHPKVLGFKLQLLVQEFYPYYKKLFPLYELIQEKNKRILFHVGTGPAGNQYVGVENFKKLLKHFPDLNANIAHMGGFEYQKFYDLINDHENLYFDTSFSFLPELNLKCNLSIESLEKAKDRILYGSDFPNLIRPRQDEINNLLNLGLSQSFYEKIFWENGYNLIKRITKSEYLD